MVRPAVPIIIALFLLAACSDKSSRAPAIGVAYAGPAALNIRKDIPLDSMVIAKVKHGDRLEIIQHRRRFMKVRTASRIEGWTDEHLLLSPQEIGALRAFEKDVQTLPSQGVATTYEPLNVHTEPNRQAPSFIQLKENEKFDVIAHRVAPRTVPARKPLVTPIVKKAAAKKKPPGKLGPPPVPAPPGPPVGWVQLSKDPAGFLPSAAAAKESAPVPGEDWSLIRTTKGESGWVLTRLLFMAIPDEVAQYAEGKRITSYFPLGDVQDAGKVKHNWLWTTISQPSQSYDFDGFRVFIWSLRRHRYETAYIERNLQGYFPVKLEQVTYGAPPKTRGVENASSNVYPGFSLCTQKSDGNRYRRTYAFMTNVVRFTGQKTCEVEPIETPQIQGDAAVATAEQPESANANRSFMDRFKGRLGALRKRWFGR